MADLQDFLRSMNDLSREDKLALRAALDEDLEAAAATPPGSSSRLIGLFKDDPNALDRVLEGIWESRALPWRNE